MSAFVLVLAVGMAVGGPEVEAKDPVAAKEESLLRLDGTWEGTWEGYGEAEEYICWRVTVRRGEIRVATEDRVDKLPFSLVPERHGRVKVVIDGKASPGIYRVDGDSLIVCGSVWGEEGPRPTSFKFKPWHSQLFTLTPAAPRKAKPSK
jgi:hypothetical protein